MGSETVALLEYKSDLYGAHVVQVEPEGTTKECATCGVNRLGVNPEALGLPRL